MTKDNQHSHARRRSEAASHRSNPSIHSDSGANDCYEDDDPTDDSGLGGDIHGGDLLQLQPHGYTSLNGPYHDAITTGYSTNSYHYR